MNFIPCSQDLKRPVYRGRQQRKPKSGVEMVCWLETPGKQPPESVGVLKPPPIFRDSPTTSPPSSVHSATLPFMSKAPMAFRHLGKEPAGLSSPEFQLHSSPWATGNPNVYLMIHCL